MVEKKVKKAAKPEQAKLTGKYWYGVGRRKTSIVRVKLFESQGESMIDEVNKRKVKEYFPTETMQGLLAEPFKLVGQEGKFSVEAVAVGGGKQGQVEATRLGIARALIVFNPDLKKILKDGGMLTRDSRKVERKKPGLKKARRAPQWQKR